MRNKKLSIITINYNNAEGLRKTLASVAAQTYHDIEHIVIDGASTDGSVEVIKEYVGQVYGVGCTVYWVSEKDSGIYNAMNKGIRKATGDYVQILNSGDILAAPNVTERMMNALYTIHHTPYTENIPDILYGNMIKKDYSTGKIIGKSRAVEYSLRQYYSATMNHDCCYIRRDLFETYGLYDEHLKIVSDWKWFLQAIGLGNVKPVYVDIDVTIFDASGISETNLTLRNQERRQVLEELLPPAILADYDAHAFEIEQMNRLRRRHLYWFVYFFERVLFKLEKWGVLR
jgi:glycosyltransferase involved in cell wall biosynthesis